MATTDSMEGLSQTPSAQMLTEFEFEQPSLSNIASTFPEQLPYSAFMAESPSIISLSAPGAPSPSAQHSADPPLVSTTAAEAAFPGISYLPGEAQDVLTAECVPEPQVVDDGKSDLTEEESQLQLERVESFRRHVSSKRVQACWRLFRAKKKTTASLASDFVITGITGKQQGGPGEVSC